MNWPRISAVALHVSCCCLSQPSPAQPRRDKENSSNFFFWENSSNFSFQINVRITVLSTWRHRDLNLHPLAPERWAMPRATCWNHWRHLLVPLVCCTCSFNCRMAMPKSSPSSSSMPVTDAGTSFTSHFAKKQNKGGLNYAGIEESSHVLNWVSVCMHYCENSLLMMHKQHVQALKNWSLRPWLWL